MLRIRQVKHLAIRLGVSIKVLEDVVKDPNRWCEKLILLDPAKPEKRREVINIQGILRQLQSRMLCKILMPALPLSDYSHGGIRGRHIKSNVEPHLKSTFVFTTDISNFYPSISHNRVYRLFVKTFQCAPDVARICTKLCTYQYHLALGLITSPILADQIMRPIDMRIGAACRKSNLNYTRYVDDLTISGQYNLQKSGFSKLVEKILHDHGFLINSKKHSFGRLSDGIPITKIRVSHGHPDVRNEYLVELERQLADAAHLALGNDFQGPYYTQNQIWGRIQFICWVNPNRRRILIRKFRAIKWNNVHQEAINRGFLETKKCLVKLTTK